LRGAWKKVRFEEESEKIFPVVAFCQLLSFSISTMHSRTGEIVTEPVQGPTGPTVR
jgi:hypothetical protein